jgi:hypothetical protein
MPLSSARESPYQTMQADALDLLSKLGLKDESNDLLIFGCAPLKDEIYLLFLSCDLRCVHTHSIELYSPAYATLKKT